MEQYIGRKIKGFKFDKDEHLYYLSEMDNYIGKEGVILYYRESSKAFRINFEYNSALYPADKVIALLKATKTITKEEATALIESMTGDKYEII